MIRLSGAALVLALLLGSLLLLLLLLVFSSFSCALVTRGFDGVQGIIFVLVLEIGWCHLCRTSLPVDSRAMNGLFGGNSMWNFRTVAGRETASQPLFCGGLRTAPAVRATVEYCAQVAACVLEHTYNKPRRGSPTRFRPS